MSTYPPNAPWTVPLWLKAAGSVIALGHLLAIGLLAVAAQSGPWPAPAPFYSSQQEGPQFAKGITLSLTYPYYLKPLRMTHNYHFDSNRVGMNTIAFEVRLKDDKGVVIETLKFPDEKANFWVRHRQSILARGLGNDQPVQSGGPIKLPGLGKTADKIDIWKATEPGILKLEKVDENDIRGDRNVMGPSALSKELAHSYVRYLCRQNNAASGELIRLHREPLPVFWWFIPGMPPADNFLTTKSRFGEFHRE